MKMLFHYSEQCIIIDSQIISSIIIWRPAKLFIILDRIRWGWAHWTILTNLYPCGHWILPYLNEVNQVRFRILYTIQISVENMLLRAWSYFHVHFISIFPFRMLYRDKVELHQRIRQQQEQYCYTWKNCTFSCLNIVNCSNLVSVLIQNLTISICEDATRLCRCCSWNRGGRLLRNFGILFWLGEHVLILR